jgi:hypothetical protein
MVFPAGIYLYYPTRPGKNFNVNKKYKLEIARINGRYGNVTIK